MKNILILVMISVMLSACIEKEINPQDIVGKWTSTGLSQKLERDGITWGSWIKVESVNNNIFFEFRSDGTFNYAPRSSYDSCFYGNRYTTTVYKSSIWINYLENKKPSKFDCRLIDIIFTPNYISSVSGDTMIRVASNKRTKYIRIK